LKSPIFWWGIILLAVISVRVINEYHNVQKQPVTSWIKTQTADCAVVLTGGAGRVREGFDLLANHQVKKLVISGVYANALLREIMPLWHFYGVLDEDDVILERRSETTFGNAQQTAPIIDALRCRDILLVTSRIHMSRAYKTFRAAYPDTVYIHKQPVIGSYYENSFFEVFSESLKSVFYSVWAF
jgi:uncharacterized SAM-binding protein YcdF (DUF218 family)